MRKYTLKQFFQDFYLVLILIFLYAPIVTMMVLSFNNTKSRTLWGGFTTKWYTQMFENQAIMIALYTPCLSLPCRRSLRQLSAPWPLSALTA